MAGFNTVNSPENDDAFASRSLRSSTERLPSRQSRGATAHGEATAGKLGGFSAPTQDVSGLAPTYALVSGLVATGAYECFGYDCNWYHTGSRSLRGR